MRKFFSQGLIFLKRNPFYAALIFITFFWILIAIVVYLFEADAAGSNINTLGDSVWWGIVTLLTVGYGDRFPVTFGGRFFAGLLMAAGVGSIAVITAKISSYFLEKALRERRGEVDSNELNQHFIICGWKAEMSTVLLHILNSNDSLDPAQVVLINGASDQMHEALMAFPRFKKIRIIKGDFWQELYLRRAAPERARKILILADATPDSTGRIPTITEADARTVMTSMTLNTIAKGTPVAAEILDSEMDQYLKLAQVNEIVYTREYSRMLLAMASMGTGVTNVFHDLLSSASPYFIATKPIQAHQIGLTYRELQEMFPKKHPKCHVVGILENSGNSHQAKEAAIRRAQQTPNMAELVNNLHAVKALRFNRPLFMPPPDYRVPEGAMVIVIEDRMRTAGQEATYG